MASVRSKSLRALRIAPRPDMEDPSGGGVTDMTCLRTPLADRGDVFVAESFARLGAGLANVLASMTNRSVHTGMTQHEIMRGMANLRTIEHKTNVCGVGVASALFQAVMDRVLKRIVSFLTGMDAGVHYRSLMFVDMCCHCIFRFVLTWTYKSEVKIYRSIHSASRQLARGAAFKSLAASKRAPFQTELTVPALVRREVDRFQRAMLRGGTQSRTRMKQAM